MAEPDEHTGARTPETGRTEPLDRAFDVLRDPTRRTVLSCLEDREIGASDPLRVDQVLSARGDGDLTRVELSHVHLPKLAEQEYVVWNPADGTIRRGAAFDEIAPMVRLCRDRRGALPGDWT